MRVVVLLLFVTKAKVTKDMNIVTKVLQKE